MCLLDVFVFCWEKKKKKKGKIDNVAIIHFQIFIDIDRLEGVTGASLKRNAEEFCHLIFFI